MANLIAKLDHKDLERLFDVPPKGEFAEGHPVFMELGNTIIQQFARRHLKALVSTAAMQQATEALRADIDAAIHEAVYFYNTDTEKYEMRREIENVIRMTADMIIVKQVVKQTKERIDSLNIPAMIDAAVDNHVKNEVIRRLRERTEEDYQTYVSAEEQALAGGLDAMFARNAIRQQYGAGSPIPIPPSIFTIKHDKE